MVVVSTPATYRGERHSRLLLESVAYFGRSGARALVGYSLIVCQNEMINSYIVLRRSRLLFIERIR